MDKELLQRFSEDREAGAERRILDYLEGKLSGEALHEVEKNMAESPLVNEAVEGLELVGRKKDIGDYVDQLNRELRHRTRQQKEKRTHRGIPTQIWVMAGILIILLIAVVAWWMIVKYQHLAH